MLLLLQLIMDPTELENEYRKKLSDSEKKFVDGMKAKKDYKDIEKDYKKNTKDIRSWYDYEVKKSLSRKVKRLDKKVKTEKETKAFKVKEINTNISKIDRLKLKCALVYFRFKIKAKNFIYYFYYPNTAYYLKTVHVEFRENYKMIVIKLSRFKRKTVQKIRNSMNNLKEKIKSAFAKFISIFKWKKKNTIKEDKKEEKKKEI